MKITKEWLEEKDACTLGREWFKGRFPDGAEAEDVVTQIERGDWLIWFLTNADLATHIQIVKLALVAAKRAYRFWSPKSDTRVLNAIKAARAWTANPTEKNRRAADAAACAATCAHAADA
ncbi:MAG: hypothetical protein KGL39_52190, partial [Patescibacteria group bacterium]|nr:hypothetical protein [Patescibacteria group bacterium]